jgi:tetratricopeptide (TPR) repeat protein
MRQRPEIGWTFAASFLLVCTAGNADASDATWSAYQDAGLQAVRMRDYSKAKRLFYEAAEEAARDDAEGAPQRMVQSVLGLGNILIQEANYAEAEKLLKDCVKLAVTLGPRHPDLAQVHSGLAIIYYRTGKLDSAEAQVRHALNAIDQETAAPAVALRLNDLANIERARKNYDAAEVLARRSIVLAENSSGPRSTCVAAGLDTLAEIHLDRGQKEQALPLAEKALEIAASDLAVDHPFLADVHDTLADIHMVLGNKDKAVDHSRQAVENSKMNFHRDHHILREALEQFGVHLAVAGRKDEAERVLTRLKSRRLSSPAAHVNVVAPSDSSK